VTVDELNDIQFDIVTIENYYLAIPLLIRVSHKAAFDAGWWTKLGTDESLIGKRNLGEQIALAQSEVSEALEGHRNNRKDTHLKHHDMRIVELADVVIRCGDTIGGMLAEDPESADSKIYDLILLMHSTLVYGESGVDQFNSNNIASYRENFSENLMNITSYLTAAYNVDRKEDKQYLIILCIANAMFTAINLAEKLGYNIGSVIKEKMIYNLTRSDHKVKNRLKSGGKTI
jgi:hypothetical protein